MNRIIKAAVPVLALAGLAACSSNSAPTPAHSTAAASPVVASTPSLPVAMAPDPAAIVREAGAVPGPVSGDIMGDNGDSGTISAPQEAAAEGVTVYTNSDNAALTQHMTQNMENPQGNAIIIGDRFFMMVSPAQNYSGSAAIWNVSPSEIAKRVHGVLYFKGQ